jgi:hypothetical protein
MATTNHVGRVKSNKRKCVIVFRTLPGDPESCLILPTENLSPEDHDAVINLVESNTGQTAYEFGEAMDRALLNDGSRMLPRFHATGKLVKLKTDQVEMTPTTNYTLGLDELNRAFAESKGVSISDLTLAPADADKPRTRDLGQPAVAERQLVEDATPVASESPLTDEDLAAQYRSQADAMYKEAKRLRDEAEALVPTKKKSTKTTESA